MMMDTQQQNFEGLFCKGLLLSANTGYFHKFNSLTKYWNFTLTFNDVRVVVAL